MNFFKKRQTVFTAVPITTISTPAPQVMETLQVIVNPDPTGLLKLTNQLDFDINAKASGLEISFALFDLLELETLMKRKPDPVLGGIVYTHPERKQLGLYVVHYFVKARDKEDFDKAGAYSRLLASYLELATTIRTVS